MKTTSSGRPRYGIDPLHDATEYAILLFVGVRLFLGVGRRIVLKPTGSHFIVFES
jgi:hypothetical protein